MSIVFFPTEKVDAFLNDFFEDRQVRKAARENGINGKECNFNLLQIVYLSSTNFNLTLMEV